MFSSWRTVKKCAVPGNFLETKINFMSFDKDFKGINAFLSSWRVFFFKLTNTFCFAQVKCRQKKQLAKHSWNGYLPYFILTLASRWQKLYRQSKLRGNFHFFTASLWNLNIYVDHLTFTLHAYIRKGNKIKSVDFSRNFHNDFRLYCVKHQACGFRTCC